MGPPGQVLFLDGGVIATSWVSFAGFTGTTWSGNLGGHAGANQKCDAAFPGAFFCTASDYYRSEPIVTPPAAGAWVDFDRDANGNRAWTGCYRSGTTNGPWTEGTNVDSAPFVNASGYVYNGATCDQLKPLACCRGSTPWTFRGYTAATYTGGLGGHPGANQKCHAEYPGARFCTSSDFYRAEPRAWPPASGAWIDFDRDAAGTRAWTGCYRSGTTNGPWTESTNVDSAPFVNASGYVYNGATCDQVKPLACCQAQ